MTDLERLDLPAGTVTLLFADIEASTRTLQALGGDYTAALARYRELVRAEIDQVGGHEVDTQGDGFFVVFERAADAVTAAAAMQRTLAAEAWGGGVPIRARMGVHTGEPARALDGYVGLDVHRAARICSAAHGGQVLVSRATHDLVGQRPFEGSALRDLGDHRLKDLEQEERLYELVLDDLPMEHPPPRTATVIALPRLVNRLIGRESELAALRALLAGSDARIVTLTGAGGAGKSRLALELAWEAIELFADGARLVKLAPVAEPDLVPSALADSLGVRDPGGGPLLDAVADYLRERELLLVVDNFEQVAPAAPVVARLVADAPRLRVLATSRTPLRLRGEHVVRLEALAQDDAVALFTERAQAADRHFDAEASRGIVQELCRRLDGLPLAIELAAARVALLPPEVLLRRLELALLTGGAADLPERQRTLAATIDWSYELLTEPQRRLHESLAVFAGGGSLDAIEAVCDPGPTLLDDLEALLAGGLLQRMEGGDTGRVRQLHVVREYALDRLTRAGERDKREQRLAAWLAGLAEQAESELAGPEQAAWLARLDLELPNVRAALDWSLAHARADLALRIASSLSRFWRARGHMREARRWLAEGLAIGGTADPALRAGALWAASQQAMAQGDAAAAEPLLEDALVLFRSLDSGREEVFTLCELGRIAGLAGDPERAVRLCSTALTVARELGDARTVSGALNTLALVLDEQSDHDRARPLHEEAVALRRNMGDDLLVANALYNLGISSFGAGDLQGASGAFGECLAIARRMGDEVHLAPALCMLGDTELLCGDPERAAELLSESAERYRVLEDDRSLAECLHGLGGVAAANGKAVDAARLWGAAERLRGDGALFAAELAIDDAFREQVVVELGDPGFAQATEEGGRRGADLVERSAAQLNPSVPL